MKQGDNYIIRKVLENGKLGKKVGGKHDSREAAERQMRAIYANEDKK